MFNRDRHYDEATELSRKIVLDEIAEVLEKL